MGFLLRCFQQFSTLHMATQRIPLVEELVDQRCILPGPLVLWKAPLNAPTPTPDMDQTVSRRSEPSSRTAFMGEQPNPSNRLQLEDAMSRHRGAKPSRRCELLGLISLFIMLTKKCLSFSSLSFLKVQTMSSALFFIGHKP